MDCFLYDRDLCLKSFQAVYYFRKKAPLQMIDIVLITPLKSLLKFLSKWSKTIKLLKVGNQWTSFYMIGTSVIKELTILTGRTCALLNSVHKFIEIQGWLLLTSFICLHNQLSRTLTFKYIFAKLKSSPALFEKIPSFVCLVLKTENNWILKLQNLFS